MTDTPEKDLPGTYRCKLCGTALHLLASFSVDTDLQALERLGWMRAKQGWICDGCQKDQAGTD